MSPRANQVLVVEPEFAGIRLADLLARSEPGVHRVDLRQLIASGEVSVNGEVCLNDRRMRSGDVVLVASWPPLREAPAAPEQGMPPVLCESATCVVVAKPPDTPCVPDRSGRRTGIYGMLQQLRPLDDLRIVHRLDRDTSGCLILAKGPDAARHFDEQFRAHRVQKVYVALVGGTPADDRFAIDLWLGPDRRRPGKVVACETARKGFREAHTSVVVRERFDRHSLLELQPMTGRGHQLRVHLQAIGLPIVADRDYGGEALLLSRLKAGYKQRTGVDERPLLQRMFLHAERVVFDDVDGLKVTVEAPLPDDLAVALRHVEKHRSRRRTQCD